MKRIHAMFVASLFSILIFIGGFSTRSQAQDEPGLIFRVPFAFSADGRRIPAGTYQINLVSSHFLMSIRNIETGNVEVFSVRPEQQRAIASQGLLVFYRCGDRKELREFHIPGSNLFSEMIAAHSRKNIEAKTCPMDETMTVAVP